MSLTASFSALEVSAPSKVILHGEHAVVYGRTAVAAALDLRTRMTLRPHEDKVVVLFPDLGLTREWSLEQLRKLFSSRPSSQQEEEVDMVYLDRIHDFLGPEASNLRMASVVCFLYLYSVIMEDFLLPMQIQVVSEIPLGAGLGSSAALSVCLAAGLTGVVEQAQGRDKNIFTCLESSLETRRTVCRRAFLSEKILHGTPSGIDNSVSSYGGIIKFVNGVITPLASSANTALDVLLVNTKVERNTKDLVAGVRARLERHPRVVEPILDSVDAVSREFLGLLEGGQQLDTAAMATLIDYNQGLLHTLGVSHPALQRVIDICAAFGLHGKLTGAGGGGFAFAPIPAATPEIKVAEVTGKLEEAGFSVVRTRVGAGGVAVKLL